MNAHNIRLRLKESDRTYTITMHLEILAQLPELAARRFAGASYFIVADSNVRRLYGEALLEKFTQRGMNACMLDFPAGEQSKNFKTIHALHTALLENGIRRNSIIVALGGGVVGDAAGYAAATILRGVRYIQVPTTLLAQVDSSVGGKVGIDHPLGKNLIGAFHQPAAVFIDPTVLRTLSQQEFRNGLAEVVKIAAALDKKFFEFLERNAGRITKTNSKLLMEIISRSVKLKAAVVQEDEYETGLRKALNLGHTIGHAIEAGMRFAFKHGEAVSIGLAVESRIAVQMGLLKQEDYTRLVGLLRALKLPTKFPLVKSRERFFSALALDKKTDGIGSTFVLLNRIGRAAIGVHVPREYIEQAVL